MKKNSYQGQAYFNQQLTYPNSNQLTPDSLYSPYMQANSSHYPDQDAFYQRPDYQYQYYQTSYYEPPNYTQNYSQPYTYYNPTGTYYNSAEIYYSPTETYYTPTDTYYTSQTNTPYTNIAYNNTLYGAAPAQYFTSPYRNEGYQFNQTPQQWNAYSPESLQTPYQGDTHPMSNYSLAAEPNCPLEEYRSSFDENHSPFQWSKLPTLENSRRAQDSMRAIVAPPHSNHEEISNPPHEKISNSFDLHQLEHSIHQSIQPIFDDAHSSTSLTDITDTLNEFESDLVKEVMAAMEEASSSKSNLITQKKALASPSTSVFQATYVPGEILGYSSTAARSITPIHSSTITAPTPSKPDHKTDHKAESKSQSKSESRIENKKDRQTEFKIESSLFDEDDERIQDTSVMTFPQWLHTICILLLPFINILALCSWACGKGNVNRVYFSRAMLVIITVLIIFTIVLLVAFQGFY